MPRIEIALSPRHGKGGETVTFDASDVATALAITDINLAAGDAELWQSGRCLGRLTKHGGTHATFWELGPA